MSVRGFSQERYFNAEMGPNDYYDEQGNFYVYVRPVLYRYWDNMNDLNKEQQSKLKDYIYIAKINKKEARVYRLKRPAKNRINDFRLEDINGVISLNGKFYIFGKQNIISFIL